MTNWKATPWFRWNSRPSVYRSLLRLISFSVRENVPLYPLVDALSTEYRGTNRRRLEQLSVRLRSGLDLLDSLEQTIGVLRNEDLLALRCAVQTGTLHEALESRANHRDSSPQGLAELRDYSVYFVAVLFVSSILFSFLAFKIFPTLKKMAEEFGVLDLHPKGLEGFYSVLHFLRFLERNPLVTALMFVALMLLAINAVNGNLFRFLMERFGIPLRKAKRVSDLLEIVAMGEEAGRPLAATLSSLGRYHSDPALRVSLLKARNDIEQGEEPWASLRDAGLLKASEAESMLVTDSRANRAWLLRRLASWKTTQTDQRSLVASAWIQPILVIAMGAFVFWLSYAVHGLLAFLIRSLS